MRRIRCLLFCAAVALPTLACAGEPAARTDTAFGTGKIDLPYGETTTVKGKIPVDLVGYWLVSENHQLPGDKTFPSLQLYRIVADPKGGLRVNWFDFKPPAAVAAKLVKAQQTQQAWSPDAEDVAAVDAAVRANPPAVDAKRRARHLVVTQKEMDAQEKQTAEAKGAEFVIGSLFQPVERPPYGQSYYVLKSSKEELGGNLTMGAIPTNVAGVPLPVGTKGVFRWIRLEVPATAAAQPAAAAPDAPKPSKKQ